MGLPLENLCRLGKLISEATSKLDDAATLANEIHRKDPERGECGWAAMGDLIEQLNSLNQRLEKLPGTEVADAISKANRELYEIWHLSY